MSRAAFSETEHQARLARAREVIAEAGLNACICVAPELLYYFGGYDAHTHFSEQAFVFGARDDAPCLIHRDVDGDNAEETSWVADRRTYRHQRQDPAALVAEACRERAGAKGGDVGRVGLCLGAYALTGAFALRLLEALAPLQVDDATGLIERLRVVKSDRELAYIREAGTMAEAGLARARAVIRPGLSDPQLAGEIERAMRDLGCEYPAMPAWVSTGEGTRGAHKTPTGRRIEAGDRLKLEFAGVRRRYHAVTMQTLWAGEAPDAAAGRAYEAAAAGLRAGSEVIAVGVPVSEAEAASFAVLEAAGFDVATHSRFGYGVGIAYPPSWLEGLDITGATERRFEANTSFVLHSSAKGPDGFGLLVGGAYILTEAGLECLSGGPLDLAVVMQGNKETRFS